MLRFFDGGHSDEEPLDVQIQRLAARVAELQNVIDSNIVVHRATVETLQESVKESESDWKRVRAELAWTRDVLTDANEWMHANPPTTSWGLSDKARDKERGEIQERIAAVLAGTAKPRA